MYHEPAHGIAIALTLAVMPTLAWAQGKIKFPARYPWVISVGTPGTTPPGQGGTPPGQAKQEEDVEPTSFLASDDLRGVLGLEIDKGSTTRD